MTMIVAMSKYSPLSEHLAAHPADEWRPSFSELESVLGFPLPKAARFGRAWWANDPEKSHSRAWTVHGWVVGDVDPAAKRVEFRRGARLVPDVVQPAAVQEAAAVSVQPVARKAGATAIAAAGVAVLAGLSAVVLQAMRRARA
ncbi:MAG TPA: hypothetical protein VJS38_00970 [Phenylobacterium sp.]|uniref:DUF7662 domain-containing protein n=1 Tax=Phenylobacterium sp. TaxID=1871053 RepID=UPI002B487EB2|nr:hypothetical protein [Phenylobacterium sp.]HKR86724.1 hypothetical protein [Phenylobacterium sp.]